MSDVLISGVHGVISAYFQISEESSRKMESIIGTDGMFVLGFLCGCFLDFGITARNFFYDG